MKKLFTILIVVALTTTASFGQVQWGVGLGLNMASVSVSGENVGDVDMRTGIRLGVTADITLGRSDVLTLNTGALYSVKGLETEDLGVLGTTSISFNYLEIPLHLSYAVSDVVSLKAGPYLGILLGSSYTVDGDDIGDYETSDVVGNSMDFGLTFGASFNVSDAISIDAGYQIGLSDLDMFPNNFLGEVEVANSNILIGMTYSFGR
tara:strand:- start:104 stop:721 length:618 start_codon:yes stop_codon:yes gene_type:complete